MITILLLSFATVCALGAGDKETGPKEKITLTMLVWEGYTEDEWVIPFEEKYGVEIAPTYVGSNDEMFAKMKAGDGAGYDLITPNIGQMFQFQEAGLLLPIDIKKIPNYDTFASSFQKTTEEITIKDGELWIMPYCYGRLPLLYNADEVMPAPTSWNVLWDEKYKGRMSIFDEATADVGLAALALGFPDPFMLTDAQLEQCKKKLIEQKPLLRKYHVGFGEEQNLLLSGEVVAVASHGIMTLRRLRERGLNIMEADPKEGIIGWCDGWAISKGTQDVELAHKWIDHCLSKDTQLNLLRMSSYAVPNRDVVDELTDEEIAAFHMDDPEYSLKLKLMKPPEDLEKRIKIWNEVKAAQVK
jgi:putative spermidine/putrescine transport system substrate-binding protein/spermidine/putrescine transport system substrate-binding protein